MYLSQKNDFATFLHEYSVQNAGINSTLCLYTENNQQRIPIIDLPVKRPIEFNQGYEGVMIISRKDFRIENYVMQYESRYYSGQNIRPGEIIVNISKRDGNIAQWTFRGVCLQFSGVDLALSARCFDELQEVGFLASTLDKSN